MCSQKITLSVYFFMKLWSTEKDMQTHRFFYTGTHKVKAIPTPHKVGARPRPKNKFKTIERVQAAADCSRHYSGLSDSLPRSPHLSALHKAQPYGQAGSPPPPALTLSHTLHQTLAPRPSSDNLGMVWMCLFPTAVACDRLPHSK